MAKTFISDSGVEEKKKYNGSTNVMVVSYAISITLIILGIMSIVSAT